LKHPAGKADPVLFGFRWGEPGRDIEVAFEDADDFEATLRVAEEDQIVFKCDTAYIGSQFRSGQTQMERKRSQMMTMCAEAGNKFTRHRATSAGLGKIQSELQ